MTRQEFMKNLEKLLWDISESERAEALQYYNDYFDDAGVENEEKILKELGNPVQVAKKIKAGFSEAASEYSEQGYEDTRFRNAMEMIVEEEKGNWRDQEQRQRDVEKMRKGDSSDRWKILAILLLCILGIPVILPLALGIVGTVLGIVVALVSIIFGIGVTGVAILFGGLVLTGTGIMKLFTLPAVGLAMAGTGCILLAVGLLISWLIFGCAVKFIPWLIRRMVSLIQHSFRKAGASL